MVAVPVKRESVLEGPVKGRLPGPCPWLFFLLLVVGLLIAGHQIIAGKKEPASPIVINEDGTVELSPERLAKLEKELEEIDSAQQYVLRAAIDGYFPCYSCPDGSPTIFLHRGEVWRYGVTRKGEELRYPGKNYGAPNLIYAVQFEGDYAECLKREKMKIYFYPRLPEALRRPFILPRPPGNKNDS